MTQKEDNNLNNVICPFCENEIKGKIPEGLKLKNIADFVSKLTMAEQIKEHKQEKIFDKLKQNG